MKTLLAAALLLLAAHAHAAPKPGAAAPKTRVLHADEDDGVTILRDAELAAAFKDGERLCSRYDERQESADRLAAKAKNLREKREAASVQAAAQRLMAECLHADKMAQARLAQILGRSAAQRLQKAAAFEDMVYVVIEPAPAAKIYADIFEPGNRSPVAAR